MSNKIDDLSIELLDTYDYSRLKGANPVVMPGFFRGNEVLFIAQNPGRLKEEVPEDMQYKRLYDAFKAETEPTVKMSLWKTMEEVYYEALQSPKGTYGTFIHDIYGQDWSNVSLTNVYKCPTDFNITPPTFGKNIPEYDILRAQIEALQPKVIVLIGRDALDSSVYLDSHKKMIHFQHPAYLRKRGKYKTTIPEYKAQLWQLLHG